ncbi:RAS1 protein [Balamuthia mandrillaris]
MDQSNCLVSLPATSGGKPRHIRDNKPTSAHPTNCGVSPLMSKQMRSSLCSTWSADSTYSIVVMGPGGVGKSCLTIQMVNGQWTTDYDPTIEDFYTQKIIIDAQASFLEILDTAGQEEYAVMRDQYMRAGEGFLIVYDVTSRASFEALPTLHQAILRANEVEDVPITLVGNKSDLAANSREVSTGEGKDLAASWGARFLETSAKTRVNVHEAFFELVREIRVHRRRCCGSNDVKKNKNLAVRATKKIGGKVKERCILC